MRFVSVIFVLCSALAAAQTPTLATRVRVEVSSGDLNTARQELQHANTASRDYPEALSWLGRGELALKNYAAAEANAAEVRKLCLAQLSRRPLDADSSLPVALGASIEVQAISAALQGRRDEAVKFLRAELVRWNRTSIRARIQKNLNLLTLAGKPAPPLEIAHSVSNGRPKPLTAYRGHPVLLFFWAHWCSDCKQEIPTVQKLEQTYGSRGLVVIGPTQHYGYVAGGEDAPREVETKYIQAVFEHYYTGLGAIDLPLSEENFARYGVSTTPTLVLIDGKGIVRIYNPGNLSYTELASAIEPLLPPKPAQSVR